MKKYVNIKKNFIMFLGMLIPLILAGCIQTTIGVDNGVDNPVSSVLSDDSGGDEKNDAESGLDSSSQYSDLEIHFIDVGQGDATLIMCGGETLLIDAGGNDKGTLVQSYVQNRNISNLKYVIGTHPDEDHIGGLDVVLYKFDCETIIMPDYGKDTKTYDDVIQVMENKNYKVTLPVVGTEYDLGDAVFTIIAPNGTYGSNANDYSVGVVLRHGDQKFVFIGDAEEASESDMLENGIDISANVYKVAHHGSRTATTQAFIDAVDPQYAVISCGEGNSYGHPHAEVLNRLRAKEIQMFRTDEQGSIVATSDGNTLTWNCAPSESWQAGEGGTASDTTGNTDGTAGITSAAPATGNETGTETVNSSVDTIPEITYILNTSSKKFHLPSCSLVKSMADKNKSESQQSRDEIIGQGYDPCGRCEP